MLIDLIGIFAGLIIAVFVIKKLYRFYRIKRVQRILNKVFRND